MESIKSILKKKFEERYAPHAKHEFQEYGIRLSELLHDKKHKTFYIKLAKERPRKLLEEARIFATEYETSSVNRGRLFMWKLSELSKKKKFNTNRIKKK